MSEPQLPREVRRRLAIIHHAEEVTGNVAMTCRYYGISRQVYYRWLRRYQEQGIDGLRDLSRRPHHSPNATHVDAVGKILYLRQNYHFGPGNIGDVPQAVPRRGGVQLRCLADPQAPGPQPAARFPALQTARQTVETLRKTAAGYQVQIDVKFVAPLKTAARPAVGRRTKYYQFTAIDDCTRLRVLRIYPRCDQKTAIQFVDYVLERLPFPVQTIQTHTVPNSNQPSTTTSWTKGSATTTSNPEPHALTAKWSDPIASTLKSSTPYSTASSSTTPRSSTTNSENGRTTTTTIALTAASAARHPTNDYARKPRPRP